MKSTNILFKPVKSANSLGPQSPTSVLSIEYRFAGWRRGNSGPILNVYFDWSTYPNRSNEYTPGAHCTISSGEAINSLFTM